MKRLLALAAIGIAGVATCQSVTAQSSFLNYDYVYGAGGDARQGSDSSLDTTLAASQSHGLVKDESGDGEFQSVPWSANLRFFGATYYEVAGDPNDFQFAFLSGLTQTSTTVNGPALAIMNGSNPGILHTLDFSVSTTRSFDLFMSMEFSDPALVGAGNVLSLQKFNGSFWQGVHTSFAEQAFTVTLSLDPGTYRLFSQLGTRSFTNEEWQSRGLIHIAPHAVPEPGIALGLLPALLLMKARRRA